MLARSSKYLYLHYLSHALYYDKINLVSYQDMWLRGWRCLWTLRRFLYSLALLTAAVFDEARAEAVRLRGSATPWDGRVEVLYEKEWGTVCDAGWDLRDANVSLLPRLLV